MRPATFPVYLITSIKDDSRGRDNDGVEDGSRRIINDGNNEDDGYNGKIESM